MTFEQSLSEALDGFIPVGQGFYVMWPIVLLFALAGIGSRRSVAINPNYKYDRLVVTLGAWIMLLLLKIVSILRPPRIPLPSGFEFIPEPLNTVLFGLTGFILFMLYLMRGKKKKKKNDE